MLFALGVLARIAISVGMSFIVSETVPSMPNKVCRFAFLFVLCVLFNFVINYFDVRLLRYHNMSWAGASIIALLFAAFGTFWPPQPRNSSTE
jgi:hypothetical protein